MRLVPRLAALAVGLTLALPTAAYAAGPTPSPGDIAAAKAKAKQTAARLDATAKELQQAQAQLTAVSAAAELAVARWQSAQDASAQADARLAAARQAASVAADTLAGYRLQLNAYAVAAYMDGGPVADLAALLNADDPADVLTRNATLQAVSEGQFDIVTKYVAASAVAASAEQAATAASLTAQQSVEVTQSARTGAATAVALAQSLLAKVQQAKDQLTAATGRDQAQVSELVQQRAAALAAERIAAARLAAQKLQSLAAVSGYPEATPEQGRLALKWAQSQLGVPYSWGGGDADGPTLGFAEAGGITASLHTVGFDCSGLTLFAWAHAGYALGHWTGAQWIQGSAVPKDELRPGDLVFFATDITDPTTIHHVGIYAGNGLMIDAPETGAFVRYDPAFNAQYIGAIRP